MSVEKLPSRLLKEEFPVSYTRVLNIFIEKIKDNDSLRVYLFLLAKPEGWIVRKEWTIKECGVSENKSPKVWSYLNRCGLIKYVAHRHESGGKFKNHDVKVLNGSKFNPDVPFKKPKDKSNKCSILKQKTTTPKNPVVVDDSQSLIESSQNEDSPLLGKSTVWLNKPLLKKDIYIKKEINKQNKNNTEISESNRGVQELNKLFDDLKINKDQRRTAQQNKPYPPSNRSNFKQNNGNNQNQVRSTVQEWGRGHPTWDAMHAWEMKNLSKIRT